MTLNIFNFSNILVGLEFMFLTLSPALTTIKLRKCYSRSRRHGRQAKDCHSREDGNPSMLWYHANSEMDSRLCRDDRFSAKLWLSYHCSTMCFGFRSFENYRLRIKALCSWLLCCWKGLARGFYFLLWYFRNWEHFKFVTIVNWCPGPESNRHGVTTEGF